MHHKGRYDASIGFFHRQFAGLYTQFRCEVGC